MKAQWIKDLVHGTLGELSVLNRIRLLAFGRGKLRARRADGKLWVHLGCGRHYIEGMVNVDVNPFVRSEVWLDLRKRLPFSDGSVDAIYCCHTLEHFFEPDARAIVADGLRTLKPGGGIRIVTPDLRKAAEAYLRGDAAWFPDFPDRRRSAGGRMANFLFCRDQHRLAYDFGFWEEILSSSGFSEVREKGPHESDVFPAAELSRFEYETPEKPSSVFVEAFRP
ncbi:MAG: methyltransferase domain-containing protein [Verrucomicrobiae bacterium]|nr:methyltransferase domain-containing protein [Verrucomicrobiae bacterium]